MQGSRVCMWRQSTRHVWPAEPHFTPGGTLWPTSTAQARRASCPSMDLQRHKQSAPGTMVGMAPPCATCWNMFCICVKAACTCSWVTPGGSCIVCVAPGRGEQGSAGGSWGELRSSTAGFSRQPHVCTCPVLQPTLDPQEAHGSTVTQSQPMAAVLAKQEQAMLPSPTWPHLGYHRRHVGRNCLPRERKPCHCWRLAGPSGGRGLRGLGRRGRRRGRQPATPAGTSSGA